jgi:hypothetical protein
LAIDKYVFIREEHSIFNSRRKISDVKSKVIRTDAKSSVFPHKTAQINEERLHSPAGYLKTISKYFDCDYNWVDEKCLIFHSFNQEISTYKKDGGNIGSNPAKL